MVHNLFDTLKEFEMAGGRTGRCYSLPALEETGIGKVSRLPFSIRIILESVLRNCDGEKITENHVRRLASWRADAPREEEVPFVVSRILLQDFTGVPLLCDLAAMRGAVASLGKDPSLVEPLVPVDLVIDHSVQIDNYGSPDALAKNMEIEFSRNEERYRFLKWGMNAFSGFRVIPPGTGIVHQVNLEYLASGIHERDGIYFPDSLVGTDSHTTMINGLGVVGWGVGGIEAEAGMLGQPIYMLEPDVIGVHLRGRPGDGVTATDLVLTITELLRKHNVVGKFVEYFGEGASALSVPDRATLANMAPEYGATMGFFPADEVAADFLRMTGREEEADALAAYMKAQGMFGIPQPGRIEYTKVIEFDISDVKPSAAGPRRPQDRILLDELSGSFRRLFSSKLSDGGFEKDPSALPSGARYETSAPVVSGDIVIAAITSCTNTSNPSVLLAAGLLAKKAVQKGLMVKPHVKTSLAPGSRVVRDYLQRAGLLEYLEKLGFSIAAFGCTTCIGNSGPLDSKIEKEIIEGDLVCCAVLSGNRNFEARIHPHIKSNYLMSPPLVVAYAIAGTLLHDMKNEPLGKDAEGREVYLRDIMPSNAEVRDLMKFASDPESFRALYGRCTEDNQLWNEISSEASNTYNWPDSTYIAEPPLFGHFRMSPEPVKDIKQARALAIFGDSVTTDHISPASRIPSDSPAGRYLAHRGVQEKDFQSYGTRRGNHDVMIRGTFSNVRIRNLMLPPEPDGTAFEGGETIFQPHGDRMSIYETAMTYLAQETPTVVFGGREYGTGSSRDWAAKGTALLGIRAVIAQSFERIHRSNLLGMGVLPLQFKEGESVSSLAIKGDEEFEILGIEDMAPQSMVRLVIKREDGETAETEVLVRIDTPTELSYYKNGGILHYVLRELVK